MSQVFVVIVIIVIIIQTLNIFIIFNILFIYIIISLRTLFEQRNKQHCKKKKNIRAPKVQKNESVKILMKFCMNDPL